MRHRVDDRSYIDRRVESVDAAALAEPVRAALRDPSARVIDWRRERIAYDFLNPSSGGIYRFAGTAGAGTASNDWTLVLKVTRAAETLEHDPPLPAGFASVIGDAIRWDRELLAYESGFLAGLDGALSAPACYGGARHDDDTCWLWLEDLGGPDDVWPLEEWERVGRTLGAFNGGFLAADRIPDADWLGQGWLRVWVTQITPFHFGSSIGPGAVWEHPLVREAYPAAVRERVWALWAERERLLLAVEALPRTCCHLDAHRRNLFLRPAGTAQHVVAIDWGLVGLAPPGEEIASTLVGTVASGELPVDEAKAFAEVLYDGYLAGLVDAGWRRREEDVRLAFTAAAALRVFSILRLDIVDDPQRAAGETAAVLSRSAALATFLLELGDEALARVRTDY